MTLRALSETCNGIALLAFAIRHHLAVLFAQIAGDREHGFVPGRIAASLTVRVVGVVLSGVEVC